MEAILFYCFTHLSSSQQHLTPAACGRLSSPPEHFALMKSCRVSSGCDGLKEYRRMSWQGVEGGTQPLLWSEDGRHVAGGQNPPPNTTHPLSAPPRNEIDAAEPQPPGRTSVWRRRRSLHPAESSSSGNNLLMESKDVSMVISPRSQMTNHSKRAQMFGGFFFFFWNLAKSSKEHEEFRCSVSHIRLKKLRLNAFLAGLNLV